MNVFEAVKQSVTTRQAAERYGIKVNRNGMCVCPFHNDKNPSMKVDRRFYCFGCGATGDVIDFVSRLHGIGSKEAALMLAQDFSIPYERSRKLFKARISALFCSSFLFHPPYSGRKILYFKKTLDICPKMCGIRIIRCGHEHLTLPLPFWDRRLQYALALESIQLPSHRILCPSIRQPSRLSSPNNKWGARCL